MATDETSVERASAQNITVKCSTPINRQTLIKRNHWPGGGLRKNGKTTIRINENLNIMNSNGEKCCMPAAPAVKLNDQLKQTRIIRIKCCADMNSQDFSNVLILKMILTEKPAAFATL